MNTPKKDQEQILKDFMHDIACMLMLNVMAAKATGASYYYGVITGLYEISGYMEQYGSDYMNELLISHMQERGKKMYDSISDTDADKFNDGDYRTKYQRAYVDKLFKDCTSGYERGIKFCDDGTEINDVMFQVNPDCVEQANMSDEDRKALQDANVPDISNIGDIIMDKDGIKVIKMDPDMLPDEVKEMFKERFIDSLEDRKKEIDELHEALDKRACGVGDRVIVSLGVFMAHLLDAEGTRIWDGKRDNYPEQERVGKEAIVIGINEHNPFECTDSSCTHEHIADVRISFTSDNKEFIIDNDYLTDYLSSQTI